MRERSNTFFLLPFLPDKPGIKCRHILFRIVPRPDAFLMIMQAALGQFPANAPKSRTSSGWEIIIGCDVTRWTSLREDENGIGFTASFGMIRVEEQEKREYS